MTSTDAKTWLITGAGRGMGVDFARAALAAGHDVVGTGRNPDSVAQAVGEHELSIDDYAARTAQTIPAWQAMNGRQAGHPAKLAHDDARVAA